LQLLLFSLSGIARVRVRFVPPAIQNFRPGSATNRNILTCAIIKKDRRACLSMTEQRGPATMKEKLESGPSSGVDVAQGRRRDKAIR